MPPTDGRECIRIVPFCERATGSMTCVGGWNGPCGWTWCGNLPPEATGIEALLTTGAGVEGGAGTTGLETVRPGVFPGMLGTGIGGKGDW